MVQQSSQWSPGRISHTDCSNETYDQLLSPMKPHTTDTHFIQTGISWNAVLKTAVQLRKSHLFPPHWHSFHLQQHTYTQRRVWISLAYFCLSLCPLSHLLLVLQPTSTDRQKNSEIMYKPTADLERLHLKQHSTHYIHLNAPVWDAKGLYTPQNNIITWSIRLILLDRLKKSDFQLSFDFALHIRSNMTKWRLLTILQSSSTSVHNIEESRHVFWILLVLMNKNE